MFAITKIKNNENKTFAKNWCVNFKKWGSDLNWKRLGIKFFKKLNSFIIKDSCQKEIAKMNGEEVFETFYLIRLCVALRT